MPPGWQGSSPSSLPPVHSRRGMAEEEPSRPTVKTRQGTRQIPKPATAKRKKTEKKNKSMYDRLWKKQFLFLFLSFFILFSFSAFACFPHQEGLPSRAPPPSVRPSLERQHPLGAVPQPTLNPPPIPTPLVSRLDRLVDQSSRGPIIDPRASRPITGRGARSISPPRAVLLD